MILDKLLFDNISIIGTTLLNKANLSSYPKDINDMYLFLNTVKQSIESDEFEGILLGNIFFSFISSKEVRDRNVTSRIFEDIFAGLFNQKCTDSSERTNPKSIPEIISLDKLCTSHDWKISTDLSGNKREKSDLTLGTYNISLKTLQGQAYDLEDNVIGKDNKKFNAEINVGSLSFRALLKGILPDEHLNKLKDRKGGLGSKPQIIKNVLKPIIENNTMVNFKYRLALFLNYVYEDDLYIVLKSNYRITFHLIPRDTFITSLTKSLEKDYTYFAEIFYRWENNNLRLNWVKMLNSINEFNLPYYSISIALQNSVCNPTFQKFQEDLSSQIKTYISKYIK